MPEHLTIEDLMGRWGISRGALAHWRMEKKGPRFFKIGRRVFYNLDDVREYENRQKRIG